MIFDNEGREKGGFIQLPSSIRGFMRGPLPPLGTPLLAHIFTASFGLRTVSLTEIGLTPRASAAARAGVHVAACMTAARPFSATYPPAPSYPAPYTAPEPLKHRFTKAKPRRHSLDVVLYPLRRRHPVSDPPLPLSHASRSSHSRSERPLFTSAALSSFDNTAAFSASLLSLPRIGHMYTGPSTVPQSTQTPTIWANRRCSVATHWASYGAEWARHPLNEETAPESVSFSFSLITLILSPICTPAGKRSRPPPTCATTRALPRLCAKDKSRQPRLHIHACCGHRD